MTTLLFVIPIITFAAGIIAGVGAWKMATNQKIETIKNDAKKSISVVATDSYEAGYMRAYSDKTRKHATVVAARHADTQVMSIIG